MADSYLPPDITVTPKGKEILSARQVLSGLDHKQIEAIEPILERYRTEEQRWFLTIRFAYSTDVDCAAAVGVSDHTVKVWKQRYTSFDDDKDMIAERMADFEMRRAKFKFQNLVGRSISEAKELLETPWDALTDRLAQVKGRLIADLWKGAGLVKSQGITVNQNTAVLGGSGPVQVTMADLARQLREGQERGVIDAEGNVIEAEYRMLEAPEEEEDEDAG